MESGAEMSEASDTDKQQHSTGVRNRSCGQGAGHGIRLGRPPAA